MASKRVDRRHANGLSNANLAWSSGNWGSSSPARSPSRTLVRRAQSAMSKFAASPKGETPADGNTSLPNEENNNAADKGLGLSSPANGDSPGRPTAILSATGTSPSRPVRPSSVASGITRTANWCTKFERKSTPQLQPRGSGKKLKSSQVVKGWSAPQRPFTAPATPSAMHKRKKTSYVQPDMPSGVLEHIRNKVYQRKTNVRDVFRLFDENHDGVVSRAEFRRGLDHMNLGLDADTMQRVIDAVDCTGSGFVEYPQFVSLLRIKDTTGHYNAFAAERPARRLETADEITSQQKAAGPSKGSGDTQRSTRSYKKAGAAAIQVKRDALERVQARFGSLRAAFRAFDQDHDCSIDNEEVAEQLRRWGAVVNQEAVDELMDCHPTSEKRRLTFNEFLKLFRGPDEPGRAHSFKTEVDLLEESGWSRAQDKAHKTILQPARDAKQKAFIEAREMDSKKSVKVTEGLVEQIRQRITNSSGGIRGAFLRMDEDRDGKLSLKDIQNGLFSMGLKVTTNETQALMKAFDRNGNGSLSFQQFNRGVRSIPTSTLDPGPAKLPTAEDELAEREYSAIQEPNHAEIHPLAKSGDVSAALVRAVQDRIYTNTRSIRQVFRSFDDKKDGIVTHREFKRALKNMNMGLPTEVIDKLVVAIDRDGSGALDYNEFVDCLKSADVHGDHNAFLLERPVHNKGSSLSKLFKDDSIDERLGKTRAQLNQERMAKSGGSAVFQGGSTGSPTRWGGNGREDLRSTWSRRVNERRDQLLVARGNSLSSSSP